MTTEADAEVKAARVVVAAAKKVAGTNCICDACVEMREALNAYENVVSPKGP